MADIASELSEILKTIRRPGDFYTSGAFDIVLPGIEIDGFGPLALPVLPDQQARLIAAAVPAPFGRGEATIIDPEVRRSWQIAPARVRMTGRRWASSLESVVARVAEGLGAGEGVVAEFYKLLVYDVGSFFVSHRDTEKSSGMFATLVIALPSLSTGGDLVVRHAGREVTVSMRGDDAGEARFAAFYADCLHEVRPVETGCRVTLVFNLMRKGAKPAPPRYDSDEERLVGMLDAWRKDETDDKGPFPSKLVYPLEHAYTTAELSFAALKGADAAAAGALAKAASRAACDLHIALLTVEQSGSADYAGGGGRWGEPEEADFDIGEIFDHSATLTDWRGLQGETPAFGAMPVDDAEFSPPDAVEDMDPDEQHFHEATGNEGASVERTYRRAALVAWPRAAFLSMIAAAGLQVSLPYLADVANAMQGTGGIKARQARDANTLARAMIASWPENQRSRRQDQTTAATTFLDLLVTVKAADRIRQFLLLPGAADGRSKADHRAIIDALSVLPPTDRIAIIEHVVEDGGLSCLASTVDLLARAARVWPDLAAPELKKAADSALALFPQKEAPLPRYPAPCLDHTMIASFLCGLCLIAPSSAGRAVDTILESQDKFGMDDTLIPALLVLIEDPDLTFISAVETLRRACIAHLTARMALPLEPPADWTRDKTLTCACADCAQLARFLASSSAQTWSLKAVEAARSHVATTIANSHCDADTATDRRGRPYCLVVTKNQASYSRRAQQRLEDTRILETIED